MRLSIKGGGRIRDLRGMTDEVMIRAHFNGVISKT
jgi:hypothetical protein